MKGHKTNNLAGTCGRMLAGAFLCWTPTAQAEASIDSNAKSRDAQLSEIVITAVTTLSGQILDCLSAKGRTYETASQPEINRLTSWFKCSSEGTSFAITM